MKIGDLVTRNSYNNDLLFVITEVDDDICYLKGVNIRLIADAPMDDLKYCEGCDEEEIKFIENIKQMDLDRSDFFYLPGKILHIDGDSEYLDRCLKYYSDNNLMAMGICENEIDIPKNINTYLEEYNPSILVITGHDAYYKKKGNKDDINNYQNSSNFVKAIKEVRKYEKNQDKLIIVAGACQSNYEELIKAGANFASSPKRINIHALDPAIVAACLSFSNKNENIDIIKILDKTKYGPSGMGGIITKGSMYIGYPR
jgi:spore coat assembly protein